MRRNVLSAPIMLLGLMLMPLGAAAQPLCTAPAPPPPLNGTEASAEQLREAISRARVFIGQANRFENCLKDEIKTSAAADPVADRQVIEAQIAANRRLQDKVSSEAVLAMDAYKKAHVN